MKSSADLGKARSLGKDRINDFAVTGKRTAPCRSTPAAEEFQHASR